MDIARTLPCFILVEEESTVDWWNYQKKDLFLLLPLKKRTSIVPPKINQTNKMNKTKLATSPHLLEDNNELA